MKDSQRKAMWAKLIRNKKEGVLVQYPNSVLGEYPILYTDGTLGYDHPERIPKGMKFMIEELIKKRHPYCKHCRKYNAEKHNGNCAWCGKAYV